MPKPATAKKQTPSTATDRKSKTPIQTKLTVGGAHDRYEAEADRVAEQVTGPQALSAAPPMISRLTAGDAQRKATPSAADDKKQTAKQPKAPPKKAAQRKAAGTGALKTPAADKAKKKAQRDGPDSGGAFTADAGTEARIEAARGGGSPLPATTQSEMGNRMGADLSGVRIHNDSNAHQLAGDLNAQAFTVGNDVFFGRGQYQPNTQGGRRLLAHELTHTVQQGGSARRMMARRIQRTTPDGTTPPGSTGGGPAAGAGPGTGAGAGTGAGTGTGAAPATPAPKVFDGGAAGTIDINTQSNGRKGLLSLATIRLPKFGRSTQAFKGAPNGDLTGAPDTGFGGSAINGGGAGIFQYRGGRPTPGGAEKWDAGAATRFSNGMATALPDTIVIPSGNPTFLMGGQPFYYLRQTGTQSTSVGRGVNAGLWMGTKEVLSRNPELLRPQWDATGNAKLLDVDHYHESAIGGADNFTNYVLLDAAANSSSGAQITDNIDRDAMALVNAAAGGANFWTTSAAPLNIQRPTSGEIVRRDWNIDFHGYTEIPVTGDKNNYWTQQNIRDGAHLRGLRTATEAELTAAHIATNASVAPTFFTVFTSQGGGRSFYQFQRVNNAWQIHNRRSSQQFESRASNSSGFQYTSVNFNFDPTAAPDTTVGTIRGWPFRGLSRGSGSSREYPLVIPGGEMNIALKKADPLGSVTYLDQSQLRDQIGAIDISGLSPITIEQAGFDGDGKLFAHGTIGATKALFPGLQVPIHIAGDAIYISFPIPTENLSFGPVSITRAAIDIGYQRGLLLRGGVDIAVQRLGTGHLEASLGADGPVISGDFNFDISFLDPATARFSYAMATDTLTLTLDAGVKQGAIPGINSGHITATMSREGIDFRGTLNPAGFLSGAQIAVIYNEQTGVTIELNDYRPPLDRFPAIQNATVSLGANKPPQSDAWSFYGHGSAQFAIPNVTGGIDLAIRDDAVTFRGNGAVQYGPASGSLNLTVTNRPVDPEGNPIEGPTQENFIVFGRGSATMRFGVITATAGLTYTPEGEIVVDGNLALPPVFELFPQQRYDKELLHVAPPEFPIWGVSVAGIGIGIFAFFDAYLKFDASVGPGTINNAVLSASYTFSRPEDTTIDGTANFNVPASAGFTVDIGGGLRARVAVASVEGRVGLAARLGIEANAGADLNLHWTPQAGLSIETVLYANVSPKFRLSANASVTASVDLGLWEPSHTWGPWEKVLGEFGPDMQCEVRVPVKWSEQGGLDLNVDNIEVKKPEVDYAALMKSAFLELV